MHKFQTEHSVEPVCYEQGHVERVLETIKNTFSKYFDDFLASADAPTPTENAVQGIADALGIENRTKKKSKSKTQNYKDILAQGLADFEKDRQNYLDIFDKEILEEYRDDPSAFKSKTLRNECPIIRTTLNNRRAKALDDYRRNFNSADASVLLSVVTNLFNFAEDYISNVYDANHYDGITKYTDLFLSKLDTEPYFVYGVIGGGVKSRMLYKFNPSVFPNRSPGATWALWYLTDKKIIDCKYDSEFLMVDTKMSITEQNYFYPYELFTFYAHQIFQLLKAEAKRIEVYINPEYRYIVVDSFLSFIADSHASEIGTLSSQISESGYGYM
jgi:hypothetical protein